MKISGRYIPLELVMRKLPTFNIQSENLVLSLEVLSTSRILLLIEASVFDYRLLGDLCRIIVLLTKMVDDTVSMWEHLAMMCAPTNCASGLPDH